MKNSNLKIFAAFLVMAVLILSPSLALATPAQVSSGVAVVALTYVVPESITVTGVPVNATFAPGATPTTGTINVTTTWTLASGHTSLNTNLYFTTPTAALSNGAGGNIPTSDIFANMDGGTFDNCTQPVTPGIPSTVAGATCNAGFGLNAAQLATQLSGTATHAFQLQLQGLSATLPAGTYTGVLNIAAGAN
jgi:hypothetical protein